LEGTSGQAADFAPRRAGAEVAADIRFGVVSAGLYRVTQPQLAAAGLTNVEGASLRLFCRTQEIAITVSTAGTLGGSDFLQFYGSGHRGPYSPTNVYWLAASGPGLRMTALDGSTNAEGSLVATYDEVLEYSPDVLYRDFYRPLEDGFDHWFAALLTNEMPTFFSLNTAGRVEGSNSLLVVRLFGLTSYTNAVDHLSKTYVNNFLVADFQYDGESDVIVTQLVNIALYDGTSTVAIQQFQSGVPNDRAYLDWIQFRFPRYLHARANTLTFCGRPGANIYFVSGFTTNADLTVLDTSEQAAPVAITNFSTSGSGTNVAVIFRTVTTNARRYSVFAPSAVRTAEAPRRVVFRGLTATSQQADYLVVTPYAFREPAYRLLKHRASNGLSVAVAPLEDIYNEFGYGIEDAAPIQQFIGYAFHHWSNPPPRYALLLGEGTYDPRNFLGAKPPVHLPVKMGPTPFSWSPRDNWYGAVHGSDNLVDVSIGRIAATSTQQLTRVVNKIMSFERSSRIRRATLVADNDDVASGYYFKAATLKTIYTNLFLAAYSLSQNYLNDASVSTIRGNIQGTLAGGRHLLTFFGHGAIELWCAENVWNTNDIMALTNTGFPIVTVFSCQTGSFEDPTKECMGEAFLEGTSYGASAVMAPASESVQIFAEKIAAGFFAEFTNETTRLGDSLKAGLTNLWNFNPNVSELWSYGILGDPALKK
jgi:hypothetical protein